MRLNAQSLWLVTARNNMTTTRCKKHQFDAREISQLQKSLLEWYTKNKRHLPWRDRNHEEDPNTTAYAVLVSEVMLQQTQVSTVVGYYRRWMERWPTLESLANADVEDVRRMWAGLGYYRRAQRLHQAAQHVRTHSRSVLPSNAAELEKLPGIGRYTSCAVASIVFDQPVAVVDGNVIRVVTRLLTIGKNARNATTVSYIWDAANAILDRTTPGDFNQALMELGALVCTPKNPSCTSCPLKSICKAYTQVKCYEVDARKEISDIESCADDCNLCFEGQTWNSSLGVTNYPVVTKRAPVKQQHFAVLILYRMKPTSSNEYFLVQRPKTGLLANLWEFPSIPINDKTKKNTLNAFSKTYNFALGRAQNATKRIGEVTHVFSHVCHIYCVESFKLNCKTWNNISVPAPYQCGKWHTSQNVHSSASSAAVKKILLLFEGPASHSKVDKNLKRKIMD